MPQPKNKKKNIMAKKRRELAKKQNSAIKTSSTEFEQGDSGELEFDPSAYVYYSNLELNYPCLSFDIVEYSSDKTPLDLFFVAGGQAPTKSLTNYIYAAKVYNLHPLNDVDKSDNDDSDDDDDDDDEEEEKKKDSAKEPRLNAIKIPIDGNVNRIRNYTAFGKTFTSTWTEQAKVHIHDLTIPLQASSNIKLTQTYSSQQMETKPIFTFGGHLSEGFAIDWSPVAVGTLATGDCKKNIHIWTPNNMGWIVDQKPLLGHAASVEDLKWSPQDKNILLSCSVDKSIRLWDVRQSSTNKCTNFILDAHDSDINVIDWNCKNTNLIASGGDDGTVKVWDIRQMQADSCIGRSVAEFSHGHAITSIEWDPNDDTVFAASSEDDKLVIWDLSVEKDVVDEEEETGDLEMEDAAKLVPDQMLFVHQGQKEIKELHWHPYHRGIILSTALSGINIFKTISA